MKQQQKKTRIFKAYGMFYLKSDIIFRFWDTFFSISMICYVVL
jgi:hypothetical protein